MNSHLQIRSSKRAGISGMPCTDGKEGRVEAGNSDRKGGPVSLVGWSGPDDSIGSTGKGGQGIVDREATT